MTAAQQKKFYFPNWAKAVEAHAWRMAKGRLLGQRQKSFGTPAWPELNAAYQLIWDHAHAIATQQHRSPTAEDMRHGCHITAFGRDKSSKDLNNSETDRVVNLFKLLADPEDLDAVLNYLYPENAARERLLYSIEHLAPDAYIRRISEDRFATQEWRDLDNPDLRQLANTLRVRGKQWQRKRHPSDPSEVLAPITADNPF